MGIFSFKKKGFVEWGDQCDKNQERLANIKMQMEAIEDSKSTLKVQAPRYSEGVAKRYDFSTYGSSQQNSSAQTSSNSSSEEGAAPFPFLSAFNSGVSAVSNAASSLSANSNPISSLSSISNPVSLSSEESVDDKKRRLANRLIQMTNQIEDLSNQVYQLQQKLELVERKIAVRGL